MDRFKISLTEYGRLTDRQIFDLYLHARKSDGSIDPALPLLPDPPAKGERGQPVEPTPDTFESASATLDRMADALRMDGAKREELRAKLKAKYGKQ